LVKTYIILQISLQLSKFFIWWF